MARQCWIDPNDSTHRVFVDGKVAPATSPAPPGNPTVPAGYVRQLGSDGSMDTNSYLNGQPVPNITIPGVPYYVGTAAGVIGADPAAGTPFHTPPSYNRVTGIND